MDDKKIIELLFARDENAVSAISEKYGAYLRKVADNILLNPDDAEECVNDTYLNAWNSIPPANPGNSLLAYLAKITRNNAINIYVKEKRRKAKVEFISLSEEYLECIGTVQSAEEEYFAGYDRNCLNDHIAQFLDSLSKEMRYVFLRRYLYCDSIENISGITGFSKGKIKSMLFRTRKGLKTFLEKKK